MSAKTVAALVSLGLTVGDIRNALSTIAFDSPAGSLNGANQNIAIRAIAEVNTPEQFENIIIRANPDGSAIYLKDVARVDLGAQDYNFAGTLNGKPTIPVGIYLAPGPNQLQVAEDVTKALAQMSQRFPTGLAYSIPYDTTSFQSMMAMPLVIQKRTRGVLCLCSEVPQKNCDLTKDFVRMGTDHVALFLENLYVKSRLRDMYRQTQQNSQKDLEGND